MKKIKLLIVITIICLGIQNAFATDSNDQTVNMFDYTDSVEDASSVMIENTTGMNIFDKDRTKVIHTNGSPWRFEFSKGRRKKTSDNAFEPEIIDYNYNPDTEEIIPITKEKPDKISKDKKNKKDKKQSKRLKKKSKREVTEEPQTVEVPVENAQIDKNDKKDKKKENSPIDSFSKSDINIYSDNMEYFEDRKEVVGNGNAKVVFVQNNSVITAGKIVYNHDLNYIEGFENVRINRDGRVMTGDYIKIDLNYGNAMMDEPMMNEYRIRVTAKSGTMTTDTLEAYDGVAVMDKDMELRLYSAQHASFFNMEVSQNMYRKFYPKEYRHHGMKYHIKTKELLVNSTDGHDTVQFKNADIYYGKVLVLKGADLTLASDKTQSFVETTIPELGSMRYVGSYFGPGFVFNTPMSSTLKLAPIVTYNDGKFGVGLMARFRHKRNTTQLFYSTASDDIVLRGRQQLGDSDFFLEYGHMSYMNDWFLGSNISKYLIQLAYQKRYVYPEAGMTISHRATAGYLTDLEGEEGSTRLRYQAMFTKNLAQYVNYDRKFIAGLDFISQGMMAVYGKGNSVGVIRVGPSIRTQYRGWGQRITYFQSAKGGESPLKYTDDYRYGRSTLQIIENLRLNKYLSIAYYTSLNLNNDDQTRDNMFSESRIMFSIGPEDAKFSFGYDMIRQGTMFNYTALIGTKNQDLSFKKLFMKNPDKFAKEKDKNQNWFDRIFNVGKPESGVVTDNFNDTNGEVTDIIDAGDM